MVTVSKVAISRYDATQMKKIARKQQLASQQNPLNVLSGTSTNEQFIIYTCTKYTRQKAATQNSKQKLKKYTLYILLKCSDKIYL